MSVLRPEVTYPMVRQQVCVTPTDGQVYDFQGGEGECNTDMAIHALLILPKVRHLSIPSIA